MSTKYPNQLFSICLELTAQTADKTIHVYKQTKKKKTPHNQVSHLLHHLLYTKLTSTRLKSRRFQRSQLEQLIYQTTDPPPPFLTPLTSSL